jgi:hypothetical protein
VREWRPRIRHRPAPMRSLTPVEAALVVAVCGSVLICAGQGLETSSVKAPLAGAGGVGECRRNQSVSMSSAMRNAFANSVSFS